MRRVTGSTIAVVLLLGLAGVLPSTAAAADADLVVTKQALSEQVEPGESVEYEISLENTTSSAITVDAVTDDLPNGFVYESGSTGGISMSDPFDVDGTLEWPVDYTVPSGETGLLSFRATASEATGTYLNSANALAFGHTVQESGPTAEVVVDFPPLALHATPSDGAVVLDWVSQHRDAESFRLFYATGETAPGVGEGTEVTLDPEQRFALVEGLDNGTTYSFSLFSFAGDRQVQAAETTATPMLPPVRALNVRGAGDDAVRLSWRSPDGIADTVVRWSASDFPDGPTDGTSAPVESGAESVRVTGLTSGTTYYFSVFATRDGDVSEAATASFEPFRCSDLSEALDAPAGLVTGSTWVECAGPGAHKNDSTLPTVMPRTGAQALMTTGDAEVEEFPSDGDDEGADLGAGSRGVYDVSVYRLDLDVPDDAQCLSFDYVFATEEWEESVGSQLNDGFIAELDNNDWSSDGSQIDAPDNFAATTDGDYVSVNSAVFADVEQVLLPEQSNTGYDGASRPLRATTPITPGEHALYLSVFDGGDDGLVDSAVFLDRLTVLTTPCSEGTKLSPKAVDDEAETVATQPVTTDVVANDVDPQGETLTVTGHTDGSDGTVSCDGEECTYTADAGFDGTDSYTYTVSNATGLTDTATVTVDVTPAPDPDPDPDPVATAVSISRDADRVVWPREVSLTGTVTGSDGKGLAGQSVTLWAQPVGGGTWTQVGAVTSGAGGAVSLKHRPDRATAYRWRTGGLSSPTVSVTVRPVVTWSKPKKVKRNKKLVVTGASTPVDVGDKVLLQRKVKKRWTTVAQKQFGVASTAPSGGTAYKLTSRMKALGKQTFRVRLPAQSGRLAVNGTAFVVRVTRR